MSSTATKLPQSDRSGPHIYVACLAAYNNAKLHGVWIDCIYDNIHDSVERMLATSPEPAAEEWAIHDYEGFGSYKLDESADFDEVETVARLVDKHGEELFDAAYDAFRGSDIDELDEFIDEHYAGCYDSPADWAEQFLADTDALSGLDESLRYYFDFDAYARDVELNGDMNFHCVGGQCYVFYNR